MNSRKLITLMLVMLALAACHDSKDEPVPDPNFKETTLYLASNGFAGYPEFIVNLDGDTVYLCEDEESSIQSLVGEGSDWYAVIRVEDGLFNVVKNGNSIHMTGENIRCFTVENGAIYTVQENGLSGKIWLCKDFQRIYEIPSTAYPNTFSVDHGHVAMGVYDEKPCYWYNGEIIPIEGLEGGFDWVYGIDKKGDDLLITYQDIPTGNDLYWWKGAAHEFSSWFNPKCSQIVNGQAYILGRKITTPIGGGVDGVATVIIDGAETILTDIIGSSAEQIVVDKDNTYILVRCGRFTDIYKNLETITLPDIEMPDFYKEFYSWHQDGKMNLSEVGIKAMAVVERR